MDNKWTQERLDDHFNRVYSELKDLKIVSSPLPVISTKVAQIEKDVQALQGDVKIIVNRTVMKQILIVSSPLFMTALLTFAGLLFSGKI